MSNTLKYAEYLTTVQSKASELANLVGDEFKFKLTEVVSSYASLFNRFCPYKVGDRVQLKETLDIPQNSGWYTSRHFLIKGAIATVKTCEYRDDLFCFGLEFDDETHIDSRGEVKPVIEKHLYYLSEIYIVAIAPC